MSRRIYALGSALAVTAALAITPWPAVATVDPADFQQIE
jgi:hypothetical protein